MADPNGEAAGLAFLDENKAKEGVVTLPSGLQYKVLVEGGGVEHPTVSSPCECHYAGRLLDGTEFDSSYKRGQPSTFAPNQVIKGWTEAMQLMVQGDKWEMYIPYQLAYGAAGKPPKIPAKAMLIFVMEIVKIKGDTIPHEVFGVFDGGKVLLKPASTGTGLIAGGGVRAVLEAAGVKNVLTKSMGSNNHIAVVNATIAALRQLRLSEDIAAVRKA